MGGGGDPSTSAPNDPRGRSQASKEQDLEQETHSQVESAQLSNISSRELEFEIGIIVIVTAY